MQRGVTRAGFCRAFLRFRDVGSQASKGCKAQKDTPASQTLKTQTSESLHRTQTSTRNGSKNTSTCVEFPAGMSGANKQSQCDSTLGVCPQCGITLGGKKDSFVMESHWGIAPNVTPHWGQAPNVESHWGQKKRMDSTLGPMPQCGITLGPKLEPHVTQRAEPRVTPSAGSAADRLKGFPTSVRKMVPQPQTPPRHRTLLLVAWIRFSYVSGIRCERNFLSFYIKS